MCGLLRELLRLTTISRAIVGAGKFAGFFTSECLGWNKFGLRIRYVWHKTRVRLRTHSWFSLCIIAKGTTIVCAGWSTDLEERKRVNNRLVSFAIVLCKINISIYSCGIVVSVVRTLLSKSGVEKFRLPV